MLSEGRGSQIRDRIFGRLFEDLMWDMVERFKLLGFEIVLELVSEALDFVAANRFRCALLLNLFCLLRLAWRSDSPVQ